MFEPDYSLFEDGYQHNTFVSNWIHSSLDNTRTEKPVPKLLGDEDCFYMMISNISQYIDEQKSKNRSKVKVRPFTVAIVDTLSPTEVRIGKGNRKKRAPLQPPLSLSTPPQDQEHELITLIEKKHACEEHKQACYVQANGGHYQYTMEDLAIWASLLQPIEWPKPDKSSSDSMPQWAQQMLMVMMGGVVAVAISTVKRSPLENLDIEYSALTPWLTSLDENSLRNKHDEHFSQYALVLVDTLKLFTLEDIFTVTMHPNILWFQSSGKVKLSMLDPKGGRPLLDKTVTHQDAILAPTHRRLATFFPSMATAAKPAVNTATRSLHRPPAVIEVSSGNDEDLRTHRDEEIRKGHARPEDNRACGGSVAWVGTASFGQVQRAEKNRSERDKGRKARGKKERNQ
ncbi:hypothetical protein BGY98DRAFT_932230 [Russula aff. rugulosa BPL654]|nr:hypothetical protein BGY98DRAFT_932230 [Russula aff. rugulosa BPL654]